MPKNLSSDHKFFIERDVDSSCNSPCSNDSLLPDNLSPSLSSRLKKNRLRSCVSESKMLNPHFIHSRSFSNMDTSPKKQGFNTSFDPLNFPGSPNKKAIENVTKRIRHISCMTNNEEVSNFLGSFKFYSIEFKCRWRNFTY